MVTLDSDIHALALRLVVAMLAGGLLGLNRDLHRKPAGVRTHALVTLGAAMATVVILNTQAVGSQVDPNALSRVVQGILTGVGFLGAGVIIRDASGHVSGLTTAATIWVAAALGIICGLGDWQLVGLSTALIMGILTFGGIIEHAAERLFKRDHQEWPGHEQ